MLPEFSTEIAESKDDALKRLARDPSAKIMAGGTDLLITMRKGKRWPVVLDISSIPSLSYISSHEETLSLGSLATHGMIAADETVRDYAPGLAYACSQIGSPQIRNAGTLGGNLVNASPAADSLPPLLVHDGSVILESLQGTREVPIEEFIAGPYKTTIEPYELVSAVRLKVLKDCRQGYRRVAKRATWAISRLSLAWALTEGDGRFGEVRLAVGSCTPAPFRARKVEDFLRGMEKTERTIARAVKIMTDEIVAVSGMRPSYLYKIPVLEGLMRMVLEK